MFKKAPLALYDVKVHDAILSVTDGRNTLNKLQEVILVLSRLHVFLQDSYLEDESKSDKRCGSPNTVLTSEPHTGLPKMLSAKGTLVWSKFRLLSSDSILFEELADVIRIWFDTITADQSNLWFWLLMLTVALSGWTTDKSCFLFSAGKEYFYLLQSLQTGCDWDLNLLKPSGYFTYHQV